MQAVNEQQQELPPQEQEQQQEEQQQQEEEQQQQQQHSTATDRMQITHDEREWALEIKAAVARTPDLDPLSDYMCAQMAIVSMADIEQTNVEVVLDRIRTLQDLRQENGVLDTLSHGCQMLHKWIYDLAEGSSLDYNYVPEKRSYAWTTSMTNFDMDVFKDPRKAKEWFAASFYIMHAFNPDLEATRRGLIILAECQDYHWKGQGMVQLAAFRKWWTEVALVYPINIQKVKYFHTGLFLNLLMSTAKRFLPLSIRERMEIGCESGCGRLDQIFLVPDAAAANERLVLRLQGALKVHYDNELNFVL